MNLGFYFDNLSDAKKLQLIQQEIERNKDSILDVSIFYNRVTPIPVQLSAGIFHVSDMWSFEGILIVDTIKELLKINHIVNRFKCWYYYYEKNNTDNFVNIINNVDIADKVLANGQSMNNEYKRLTNKEADWVVDQYENISRVGLL